MSNYSNGKRILGCAFIMFKLNEYDKCHQALKDADILLKYYHASPIIGYAKVCFIEACHYHNDGDFESRNKCLDLAFDYVSGKMRVAA